MKRESLAERARQEIIRLCHSALDSRTLRVECLEYLRPIIAFDYAYFTTTDPATGLGSGTVIVEQPPSWCMAAYIENEFLQEDFIKFRDMVRDRQRVGILSQATQHEPLRSQRYRDMLLPMGMGDELRAVFAADGVCWGTLCLHREHAGSGYSAEEGAYLAQLAPHLADGLRKALLLNSASAAAAPQGPGVLILDDDLSIAAATAAADYWLAELRETEQIGGQALPLPLRGVVASLQSVERGLTAGNAMPKIRLRTRSGAWLVVSASRLRRSDRLIQISVIFEVAQPAEIAPLIMQAYDLTTREGDVTQCVLLGWSTSEIAARLHISPNTVQDHLKAVFEKVAVNSRGELAARIFRQQN